MTYTTAITSECFKKNISGVFVCFSKGNKDKLSTQCLRQKGDVLVLYSEFGADELMR